MPYFPPHGNELFPVGGGGGGTSNLIVTEANDPLITESGDNLITED